jgi:hypothetical protein
MLNSLAFLPASLGPQRLASYAPRAWIGRIAASPWLYEHTAVCIYMGSLGSRAGGRQRAAGSLGVYTVLYETTLLWSYQLGSWAVWAVGFKSLTYMRVARHAVIFLHHKFIELVSKRLPITPMPRVSEPRQ